MPIDPLAPLVELAGVADRVAEVRAAVDKVLAQQVLRRRSAEVSGESALRGAWAAARLSGSAADLAAVRSGASGDVVALGALRAYAQLGSLSDTWTRAPRQVLARLHVLAARDLADAQALGRPAAGAERLDVLSDVLAVTRAPAVVVAAVALGEILALDAFAPVSPVVGWAAVRLTFIERGLDPKSLVMPELGALESAAPLAAYRTGDLAGWIGYLAGAVLRGSTETLAVCEALRRG